MISFLILLKFDGYTHSFFLELFALIILWSNLTWHDVWKKLKTSWENKLAHRHHHNKYIIIWSALLQNKISCKLQASLDIKITYDDDMKDNHENFHLKKLKMMMGNNGFVDSVNGKK